MHLPQTESAPLYRFTLDHWHRMIEAGVLGEEDHVELVEGRVYAMTPQGKPHGLATSALTGLLARALSDTYSVRAQLPLTLGGDSEPEPDLAVVLASEERAAPVHPRSALLVVEVANTSLGYDRSVKLPLYARAGIPEVWIVDVVGRAVEVYRGPLTRSGRYRTKRVLVAGQALHPTAVPGVSLPVDALFK